MTRLGQIPGRLYRGEISVNIVGRQRMWYTISGLIVLVSAVALAVRGLNFSVEFKGGSVFKFPASPSAQDEISRVVSSAGGGSSTSQYLGGPHLWQVTTGQLASKVSEHVTSALQAAFHVLPGSMSVQFVGPTWGSSISSKATEALIIFLVVIVVYLSIAFEWKMAVSAFVALLHDIVITIGVYALIGFQVSPTSVIGLLTILGYSLYDTVVVFDKVRENTAGLVTSERSTYTYAANLALNQTLVRSINTSLTALIPVASILFIGGALLGAGTLNDLSLVLFVGMLSGTYSSLCIATPVLADLKEREPALRKLRERIERRQAGGRAAAAAAAAARREEGAAAAPAAATRTAVAAKPGPAGKPGPAAKPAPAVTTVSSASVPEEPEDDADSGAADSEFTVTSPPTRPARTTVRQQPRRGTGGSAQRKKRR